MLTKLIDKLVRVFRDDDDKSYTYVFILPDGSGKCCHLFEFGFGPAAGLSNSRRAFHIGASGYNMSVDFDATFYGPNTRIGDPTFLGEKVTAELKRREDDDE